MPPRSARHRLGESPSPPSLFIFVHIGKTGGGSVRRGFWGLQECSARRLPQWTGCLNEGGVTVGNSNRHRMVATPERTFEPHIVCPALSPLAVLGACRLRATADAMESALVNASPPPIPIVHMGHYRVGSELSWLGAKTPGLIQLADAHATALAPPRLPTDFRGVEAVLPVLASGYALFDERALAAQPLRLNGSDVGGPDVFDKVRERRGFTALSPPEHWPQRMRRSAASPAVSTLLARQNSRWSGDLERNWGPLYEALGRQAVARITMLRSPWTHLASIFYFFGYHRRNYSCTDPRQVDMWAGKPRSDGASISDAVTLRLCGVDCEARFLAGASVQALEAQAAYNLRYSFALVGVTEQFEGFIEAVRRLAPNLRGFLANGTVHAHGRRTQARSEEDACKSYWSLVNNQREGLQESQVIRQMVHLYRIALEIVPASNCSAAGAVCGEGR